jgi:uncharacterized protein YjgD (DUF1641 family)
MLTNTTILIRMIKNGIKISGLKSFYHIKDLTKNFRDFLTDTICDNVLKNERHHQEVLLLLESKQTKMDNNFKKLFRSLKEEVPESQDCFFDLSYQGIILRKKKKYKF